MTETAAAPVDQNAPAATATEQQQPNEQAPAPSEKPTGNWRGEFAKLYTDDDDGDVTDHKPVADKPAAPAEGEKPAAPAAPATQTRFQVLDAEGKPAAVALPEGAQIRFKASGKDVTVKSLDDLVQYAQKGVDNDRKSSEFGQQRRSLELGIQDRDAQLATAEETLLAVLFDEDVAERLRAAAEKYRDPEVRKGLAAQQKLEQREQQDKERSEATRAQAAESFWTHAETEFNGKLAEHEYLRAEDAPEAVELFYNRYLENRESLFHDAHRKGYNISDPQVVQTLEQQAGAYLDQAKLLDVMSELNAHYRARLGPIAGQSKEQQEIADADKHNRITANRLSDRNTRRTLHGGGGTAPAPVSPAPQGEGDRTWEGSHKRIRGLFDSMRT